MNRFRKNFSYDSLKELLSHYSYIDLTTYYENEAVLYSDLRLVADPTNPYVVLNQENTVYKYAPENLVDFNGIYVQMLWLIICQVCSMRMLPLWMAKII